MGAKLLLDSPSSRPALGFGPIAGAFAQIIESSEPRFAIGIFGDWGSGKTTLMDAIEAQLSSETTIVVRFNAWRFEREHELLVPLLDAIRDGLVRWAEQQKIPQEAGDRARKTARRIGRVVRALLSGVSVEVGVSAVAKVSYDAGALQELKGDGPDEAQAQSLYYAGFAELSSALEEFGGGGAERIVVFVDDLDRCLPSNALEVLEAMKLFFDLPGFVFVLGLDEAIVERAVQARFADVVATQAGEGSAPAPDAARLRSGSEYVKKLFQVPYNLPSMLAGQLDELLEAMYVEASLEDDQLDDLRKRARRYLLYVARDDRVNPREVKRFINAYTLQTLVRPELERDIVLALQTIAFRSDWDVVWELLETD